MSLPEGFSYQTPESERIPIRLVVPLIHDWLEKHEADHPNSLGYQHSDNEGYLGILAFRTGVSARRLRMILQGRVDTGKKSLGTFHFVDWITFSMADKIVINCAPDGPYAWRREPLKDFYGPLSVASGERKYKRNSRDDLFEDVA